MSSKKLLLVLAFAMFTGQFGWKHHGNTKQETVHSVYCLLQGPSQRSTL